METSTSSLAMTNRRVPLQGIGLENPFSFKVLQVFTGFGFGCGIGIGVGSPMNLGALPMVGEVMSATRGATNAFSGVNSHVNNALRKLGARNIQTGIGCGVGFGHGIGIGLGIKPGVVQKVQASLVELMMKMMMKLGVASDKSTGLSALKAPLQGGMSMLNETSIQKSLGGIAQLAPKLPEGTSQNPLGFGNLSPHSSYEHSAPTGGLLDDGLGSRTEKVISSFLQNPILKEDVDGKGLNEEAGRLRSENNLLQMVLKHQQIIEKLMEENEKLQQILVEDLKVSPSKLQDSYLSRNRSPCSNCFECRRKQRRR